MTHVDRAECMSKQKLEVQQLYVKLVLNEHPAERGSGKLKLLQQNSFIKFTSTVCTSERVPKYVANVLNQLNDGNLSGMAQAFDALESFAQNLMDFPWKKEFRIILTYSGFYKTQLEPYIGDPFRLLGPLGYQQTDDHKLRLTTGRLDQQKIAQAAFDFFLASTECRTTESIVLNTCRTVVEVCKYRWNNAGDDIDVLQLSATVGNESNSFGAVKGLEKNGDFGNSRRHLRSKIDEMSFESGMKDSRPNPMDAPDSEPTASEASIPSKQQQVGQSASAVSNSGPAANADARSKQDRLAEVNRLAAFLADVDPDGIVDINTRRKVLSRLQQHSRSISSSDSSALCAPPLKSDRRPFSEPFVVGSSSKIPEKIDIVGGQWAACQRCGNCNKSSSKLCGQCKAVSYLC